MRSATATLIQDLLQALPGRVFTDPLVRTAYSYDASYVQGNALAVVFPEDVAEVAACLRLAHAAKVAVVVRGAGSGLAGGSVPEDAVVLSTIRLKELAVDAAAMQAVVGAGVTTEELKQAVARHGLVYPPDPGSGKVSTVGGNLATNAGGSHTLRYGTTRHYVLGLTVVLADGTVVETGGRTTKNQSGYDLTSLFVGSEGTLGVIVRARLRLVPRVPEATATLVAGFDDLETLGAKVVALRRLPFPPTAIEVLDRHCLGVLSEEERRGIPAGLAGVLFVRQSWPQAVLPEAVAASEACLAGAPYLERAEGAEERRLWQVREALSPAVARLKPTKISEDATVPVTELAAFLRALETIREEEGVLLLAFGHAGDGNLHPNILCDAHDPEEMARVERAIRRIFETAAALGGTLSGEHGIGLLKVPFLGLVHSPEAQALFRRLKDAFDPEGILNPGKLVGA